MAQQLKRVRKSKHEEFTRFFEEPTRETLRELLRTHVGEADECDFKEEWPEDSKTAKHILGIANSGGGCIVIGMRQEEDNSLVARGLARLRDKADISNGLKGYLPRSLGHEVLDFAYAASEYPALQGKAFQVVAVDSDARHLPYLSSKGGNQIRENAIYIRRGTSTAEASHEELQNLINRRLETGYSTKRETDLQRQLAELKVLHQEHSPFASLFPGLRAFGKGFGQPSLPETYQEFIVRMIEAKVRQIENLLGVGSLNDHP